ncbi:MAG: hypothetical protein AB7V50_06150 [Vampirovibrionia bacterium]
MPKILLLTLIIGVCFSPLCFGQDENTEKEDQKYFVKKVCSGYELTSNVEDAANTWLFQNPSYEIESVSYAKINDQDCVILLYETK